MAKIVQRPKLSLLERLFLPTLWNGFKVTLGHFFSWKKSGIYEDKNQDNQFKTTLSSIAPKVVRHIACSLHSKTNISN